MTRLPIFIILTVAFLAGTSHDLFAQFRLVFSNDSLKQAVEIRSGDIIKLEYQGYLSQPEILENRVIQVREDNIVLGRTVFGYADPSTLRTIMLRDITGFRKFSRLRYTLRTAATVGTAVGSIILFREVIDRSRLTNTSDILLTLGVGIGSSLIVELLFPKKVKHKIQDGWHFNIR